MTDTHLMIGGTGGIGKASAVRLDRLGARVGISGRDIARAEAAAADIRATSNNDAVHALAADQSSQTEVRRLAREVLDLYPRLDVLVNNVGGFWTHRRVTADGLEHTVALNHLAAFLLTNLLLDRLKGSAPARIVTVSSGAHTAGHIDFDDLQAERNYSGLRAYNPSKLANVTLEARGGFGLPVDVDRSFDGLVNYRVTAFSSCTQASTTAWAAR